MKKYSPLVFSSIFLLTAACAQESTSPANATGDITSSAKTTAGLSDEFTGPFKVQRYEANLSFSTSEGASGTAYKSDKPGTLRDMVISKSKTDPARGTISLSLFKDENNSQPRCNFEFIASSEKSGDFAVASVEATSSYDFKGSTIKLNLAGKAAKKDDQIYWEFNVVSASQLSDHPPMAPPLDAPNAERDAYRNALSQWHANPDHRMPEISLQFTAISTY